MEYYRFKESVKSLYKGVDAQKAGEEIKALGGNENKPVKPEFILEYARANADSELHKCFCWDDKTAAEKFRLEQARRITRSIIVVIANEKPIEQPKTEVRAFFEETRGGGYRPTTYILRNKNSYEKLLENAWAELKAFKKKYHILTELEDIFNLID